MHATLYFEFEGHYDDVRIFEMAKWDMKSYLQIVVPEHPKEL